MSQAALSSQRLWRRGPLSATLGENATKWLS